MNKEVLKIVETLDCDRLARDHIASTKTDESFFISNVGDVVQKLQLWLELLPQVHPAYAMKANSHVSLVGTLAALGEQNVQCLNVKWVVECLMQYEFFATIFYEHNFFVRNWLRLCKSR